MNHKIELIVLDVDGVLTDGKLIIGPDGIEHKSFNSLDGMGISLAKFSGIKIAIITGRISDSVSKRADELKIDYVYQGINDKKKVLDELLEKIKLNYESVCYIGDDLNDLPILEKVGFSASPQNAVEFVKNKVDYVANKKGGEGAVREVIDKILIKFYAYDNLIKNFIDRKETLQ